MMLYDFERVKIMKRLFITIGVFTMPFLTGCGWNPFGPGDGSEPRGFFPWPLGAIDYDPAWSPDGSTTIYYHAANYGDSTDTCGLYFINPDGTDRRLFLNATVDNPDWSPDGEWIAFSSLHACIWKIKVNGDSLTQLTFNRRTFCPDWSPDGKKIAYNQSVSTETHPPGIWIMDADGSNDHLVFEGATCPDWSPDGSKIVRDGIYVADTNGTNTELIHQGGRHPVWSPDGSKIAFISTDENEYGLWIMNSNGDNPHCLTQDICFYPCSWSPDGEYIVYTSGLEGSTMIGDSAVYAPGDGRLWVINADGTDKYQLTFP